MAFDLDDQELKATRKLLGLDKVTDINVDDIQKNINNLKVYLKYDNIYQKYKIDKNTKNLSDFDIFCIEHCIDIDNLINEYERQKQINEEHQKINGELREKVKELEIDLTTVYMKGFEDGKDKYKQKIKDKIEELKDTLKHYDEYSKLNLLERVNIDLIDSKIEILEELLQESEDK